LLAHLEYSELKRLPDAFNHFSRLLKLKPDHSRRNEYSSLLDQLGRTLSDAAQSQRAQPALAPSRSSK
jgi:uncharacterized protein HemY